MQCNPALGSQHQIADGISGSPSDDERQARLDAAARRCIPRSAERRLAAVQSLRERADAAGNLKTTKQQKVEKSQSYIRIEPEDPATVYVPAYNPEEIYGSWPYPDLSSLRLVSARLCRWPWHLVGIRRPRRLGVMGHRKLAKLGRRHRSGSLQSVQSNQHHGQEMAAQR